MFNNLVPAFHFISAEEKLTDKFFEICRTHLYGSAVNSLLFDKNIGEIENYTAGKFPLDDFEKVLSKTQRKKKQQSGRFGNQNTEGLGWHCLPLITQRYIAGVGLIYRLPQELTVRAIDPLAADKKKEDVNFLRNKPQVEEELNQVAAQFNVGKIDLGTTQHSSEELGTNPYGMDLNEPDELNVFVNLLYALKVEAAVETILSIFKNLNKRNQIRLLEIRDQFKFAVSCHMAWLNPLTGLPSVKYLYPNNVEVPYSDLPDFSDNNCRFHKLSMSAADLPDFVGREELTNKKMETVMNDPKNGYLINNEMSISNPYAKGTNEKFNVNLKLCQFISLDCLGVVSSPKKSKYTYLTDDYNLIQSDKCRDKIWAQNTYTAYWLVGTPYYFQKDRLPFGTRQEGQETYSRFSSNIYKSQVRSAVELSIPENKVAQEAYIKMQHAVRKALPRGVAIDAKLYANFLGRLTNNEQGWTLWQLLQLGFEENIHLTDTTELEAVGGQAKAVETIMGGLDLKEIGGYIQVIQNAKSNIAGYMGVNDQIAGLAYDAAVGNNELAVKAALNSIRYVADGMEEQDRKLYNNWTFVIKQSVEGGGKPKQTLIDLVSAEKVALIDGIDDIANHQMEAYYSIDSDAQDANEIQKDTELFIQQGILTPADKYLMKQITNNRDKTILMICRYNQWEKKQAKKAEDARQQQLAAIQAQGQNVVASKQAEAKGEQDTAFAKGQVNAKITELQGTIDKQKLELESYAKMGLQKDRSTSQLDKALRTMREKYNLESQKAVA